MYFKSYFFNNVFSNTADRPADNDVIGQNIHE